MSLSWDFNHTPQGTQITVPGLRPVENDWNSITPSTLALFGVFNFGAGDQWGTYTLPTLNNPQDERTRQRVDRNEPSAGQEDFAADGDPFNDGEAPTRQTVNAWLNDMAEAGTILSSYLQSDAGDGATTYSGYYTTNDGRSFTFSSDGNGSYGQSEVGASGASFDDFMF